MPQLLKASIHDARKFVKMSERMMTDGARLVLIKISGGCTYYFRILPRAKRTVETALYLSMKPCEAISNQGRFL